MAVGTVVVLALFVGSTVCFLLAPHVAVAATIPLFASIPVLKVLAVYWVGPVKDAVTLSAALAAALYVLQREGGKMLEQTDTDRPRGSRAASSSSIVLNVGGSDRRVVARRGMAARCHG